VLLVDGIVGAGVRGLEQVERAAESVAIEQELDLLQQRIRRAAA
jgi:hypothetical protein